MMNRLKEESVSLVCIAMMFVLGLVLKPYLPEMLPNHWNIYGQVNGYIHKSYGVFFMPFVTLGVYLLLLALPKLDPRAENYIKFSNVYQRLKLMFVLFFVLLYFATLSFAMGWIKDITKIMILLISFIFMLLGNYFGKIRQNYFVGIKVPWTLADEEVWNKTHRFGGRLWVLSGLLGVIGIIIPAPYSVVPLFSAIFLSTIITIIYSYLIYKTKEKK